MHLLHSAVVALRHSFLLGIMVVVGPEVVAQSLSCEEFRSGKTTTSRIAVFKNLEDMSDGEPSELRTMSYRKDYVKQPHIRGYFGQYPPPDYELGIGFEINIDTGKPVPQSDQAYTSRYKENRDFRVSIRSTWATLAEHLHPAVALPIDRSVTTEDYEVIGQRYEFSEVSFISAIEAKSAGDYALRANRNSNVFLDFDGTDLSSYMICRKTTEIVKVPHCEHFQILAGFLTETRFKSSLIDDYETIISLSETFVGCLFAEQ